MIDEYLKLSFGLSRELARRTLWGVGGGGGGRGVDWLTNLLLVDLCDGRSKPGVAGLGNRAVGLAEVCAEVGVGVAFPDDPVVILCVGVIQDLPQGLFRAGPVGARFFWPQILQPSKGSCSNRFLL